MKHKSLLAFLVLVTSLSLLYIAVIKMAGEIGRSLAQGYMIIPALAALITRRFFDERGFTDADLRWGHWQHYVRFWLFSLGIAALYFLSYTVLGVGKWDFTGGTFLENLARQLAATGKDIKETLPDGMSQQGMLFLFFIGGLTVFNIIPGMITGLGEEFGWRGLMFQRLFEIRPWVAFIIGGLVWFVWHLPLLLVVPQQLQPSPGEWWLLLVLLAIGAICTHTYLAYVYFKTRNIFVTALAHIVLDNASASFGYLFVLQKKFLANSATVLVMVMVVGLLYGTGQMDIFKKTLSTEMSVEAESE